MPPERKRNFPAFASKGKNWIHTIHWEEGSDFSIAAGTESFVHYIFRLEDSLIENRLSNELLRWCSNTIPMACSFFKVKKISSWKLCASATRLYPDCIKHEANITALSPSEWTSTAPVVETSEPIELNDNDLMQNAIGYTFSKIFYPEMQQTNFYSSLGDRELGRTPFLWQFSPQRRTWKLKKNFTSFGRLHSLLVAFKNTKTRRHTEIQQTRSPTKQDFSEEAFSTQNTEAQLASLSHNSFRATTAWSATFA